MRYLIVTLILFSATISNAQQLLRGPYLQTPTDTSIVIMWRTDSATPAEIKYGDSPTNLTQTVTDNASVTDHEVRIGGLSPYTTYYYSIGDGNTVLSGGDAQHRFRTHPTPGTVLPFRVWAIGDFGKANQGQHDVWQSYIDYTNNETDVWLWLGDNAYDDGTDQEYQDKVFHSYYGYDSIFRFMPFYPIPGNHDYNSVNRLDPPDQHVGPYYDLVSVPENGEAGGLASGSELYYSFDYGNAHFIGLNSELQDYTGALSLGSFNGSVMLDWLEQDLQQNDKEWVIAYWHQPPYSKGSHNSPDIWEVFMQAMRENVLPILEAHNVDLVICGHSHVYERSYLIRGHYDNNWNASQHLVDGSSGNPTLGEEYEKYLHPDSTKGTMYIISGNAASSTSGADLDYPAIYFSDGGSGVNGSLVLDIHGSRLDGKYLRSNGNVLDEFAIVKPDGKHGVGVGEINPNNSGLVLNVSPSPFTTELTVDVTMPYKSKTFVELYTIDGKLVQTIYSGILKPSSYRYKVDAVSNKLANGVYLVKVRYGDKEHTQKVVKVD